MARKPRPDTRRRIWELYEKAITWSELANSLGFSASYRATLWDVAHNKPGAISLNEERLLRDDLGLPPIPGDRQHRPRIACTEDEYEVILSMTPRERTEAMLNYYKHFTWPTYGIRRVDTNS